MDTVRAASTGRERLSSRKKSNMQLMSSWSQPRTALVSAEQASRRHSTSVRMPDEAQERMIQMVSDIGSFGREHSDANGSDAVITARKHSGIRRWQTSFHSAVQSQNSPPFLQLDVVTHSVACPICTQHYTDFFAV